jgi:HprK-related kinase A
MTPEPLASIDNSAVRRALGKGTLRLHLGPFVTALRSGNRHMFDYFLDMYRDCPVSIGADIVADYYLRVGAPNMLRRLIRRQVLPDPGFHFPTLPLPVHMAPLALEMGMNLSAALQCFRFTMFHAGVVARGADAVMIAAHSGGGKSTLTAAMMEAGYRLLSDEFAVLRRDRVALMPYPRPVSLKNASVDVVRELAGKDMLSKPLVGTPKGTVAYRRARASDIQAMHEEAIPRLLIFPTFKEKSSVTVSTVEPADAAMRLIAGSPNYQVVGREAFETTMAMMDGLNAFEIRYGNTADSVNLVQDLLGEATA